MNIAGYGTNSPSLERWQVAIPPIPLMIPSNPGELFSTPKAVTEFIPPAFNRESHSESFVAMPIAVNQASSSCDW
ncbi:hypothetical protein [Planctomicrobium sp. SH527]|uniref:hypothetical protein n=1 Tax=Planctomicrobium sp. SH527 TaxID=3448123 RepID=UPI003F5BC56A